MNNLPDDLETLTKEINGYALVLGETAWKLGEMLLGKEATIKQIANRISPEFGFPAEMIIQFMLKVKRP